MDILEIGNGGLTNFEEESVFSLWCALKSPLLLGNDLSNMTEHTMAVIGNEPLLAINQDELGVAAKRVVNSTDVQVWSGPLANGDVAVVLLNLGNTPAPISVAMSLLGYGDKAFVNATDLWSPTHATRQVQGTLAVASVESHGVAAFRLKPMSDHPLIVN
jgi:alpha-galactosidase